MSNTNPDNTLELVRQIVVALSNKKAEQLVVLHVTQSDITDYLVLANGNSEPHLRALRIEAERVLDSAKAPIAGMEQGTYGSGWTVLDGYQVMVHLFTAEQRENYSLEKLWKDAEKIDAESLINPPKPKRAATAKTSKTATKKPATAKKTAAKAKAPSKAKAATKSKAATKTKADPKPKAAAKKATTAKKAVTKSKAKSAK